VKKIKEGIYTSVRRMNSRFLVSSKKECRGSCKEKFLTELIYLTKARFY
jgi:hypothetical protein